MSNENMQGQTVVITGANRGIGFALVQQYLKRSARVIALCRQTSIELRDCEGVTIVDGIEVTSADCMGKLQQELRDVEVDILINNAGLLESETLSTMNFDTILRQYEVNAMAPLRVTTALLPNLVCGAKIGLITSRMGSIADNGSGGSYGYRMSKAALNAAGVSLAHDLKPNGIAVALLHPGFVQTDMVGYAGDISAEVSAQRLVQRMDELNLENTGTFWHSNGEVLPW